jgi:hypothetical protein
VVAVQKRNGPLAAAPSMEAGKNNNCVYCYSVAYYNVCKPVSLACFVVVMFFQNFSSFLIVCTSSFGILPPVTGLMADISCFRSLLDCTCTHSITINKDKWENFLNVRYYIQQYIYAKYFVDL